jgi:hypothetical protein
LLFGVVISFSAVVQRLDRVSNVVLWDVRLFNLFWINRSWQKRFTAEDVERRRDVLFSLRAYALSAVF